MTYYNNETGEHYDGAITRRFDNGSLYSRISTQDKLTNQILDYANIS